MAKRLRQVSLLESFSKKRAIDPSDADDQKDLPTMSSAQDQSSLRGEESEDIGSSNEDPSEFDSDNTVVGCGQSSGECSYCQSFCCSDETKPYQPTNKHTLLSMENGGRNFMARWYSAFNWITLCTERKKAFCFYCRIAQKKGMLSFSTKAEAIFSTVGFSNWRKAIQKFRNHSACHAHTEAVTKWQLLQAPPISAQLSTQVQKLQQSRRQALIKQLCCLRYLLRQGLAIRGHTETEGNLYQLLMMMSVHDSEMTRWLNEKSTSLLLL